MKHGFVHTRVTAEGGKKDPPSPQKELLCVFWTTHHHAQEVNLYLQVLVQAPNQRTHVQEKLRTMSCTLPIPKSDSIWNEKCPLKCLAI